MKFYVKLHEYDSNDKNDEECLLMCTERAYCEDGYRKYVTAVLLNPSELFLLIWWTLISIFVCFLNCGQTF